MLIKQDNATGELLNLMKAREALLREENKASNGREETYALSELFVLDLNGSDVKTKGVSSYYSYRYWIFEGTGLHGGEYPNIKNVLFPDRDTTNIWDNTDVSFSNWAHFEEGNAYITGLKSKYYYSKSVKPLVDYLGVDEGKSYYTLSELEELFLKLNIEDYEKKLTKN